MVTDNPNFTVIHSYSRAQALEEGELVDADSLEEGMTRSAGFTIPVALTRAAWLDCVHWDETIEATKCQATGQDPKGRLWDVLGMARLAAMGGRGSTAPVSVLRVPADGSSCSPEVAVLRLQVGPGDQGEPVATLLLPGED